MIPFHMRKWIKIKPAKMHNIQPAFTMDRLGNTKVFVIPKKNSTLNGSKKWKDTMKEFVENTMPYLEEYH